MPGDASSPLRTVLAFLLRSVFCKSVIFLSECKVPPAVAISRELSRDLGVRREEDLVVNQGSRGTHAPTAAGPSSDTPLFSVWWVFLETSLSVSLIRPVFAHVCVCSLEMTEMSFRPLSVA